MDFYRGLSRLRGCGDAMAMMSRRAADLETVHDFCKSATNKIQTADKHHIVIADQTTVLLFEGNPHGCTHTWSVYHAEQRLPGTRPPATEVSVHIEL